MKTSHIYFALLATAAGTALCNQGVLILSAARLGMPEALTSTFGALVYTGFLLLPISFKAVRRFGANVGMGGHLLIMALSMLGMGGLLFFPPSGWLCLLFFTLLFLMQSMVSMSNAMFFLLQKTIPPGESLDKFISRRSYLTQGGTLAFTLVTVWYLAGHQETRQLSTLYWGSFFLFAVASVFYARMGDSQRIRDMLAQPFLPSMRQAIHFPAMRRLLPVGVIQNLAHMTLTPNCILALKSARQATENQIVLLTSLELVTAIVAAFAYKRMVASRSPSKCMFLAYHTLPVVTLFWWLVPEGAPLAAFALPLAVSGIILIFCSMAMANHFTIVIPDSLQMSGTMLVMLVHGVLTGLLGIALNSLLHQAIDAFHPATPWTHYRLFFSVFILLYFGCLYFGRRLDKRR